MAGCEQGKSGGSGGSTVFEVSDRAVVAALESVDVPENRSRGNVRQTPDQVLEAMCLGAVNCRSAGIQASAYMRERPHLTKLLVRYATERIEAKQKAAGAGAAAVDRSRSSGGGGSGGGKKKRKAAGGSKNKNKTKKKTKKTKSAMKGSSSSSLQSDDDEVDEDEDEDDNYDDDSRTTPLPPPPP